MIPFSTHRGVAAPLLIDDMNTDVIIPTARAVHIPRERMGHYAFEELRYDAAGEERQDFVLNRKKFRNSSILLAGANFGCGSSREMAVWALQGLGIRSVIASGFGDIFRANCVKNGLLPVVVSADSVAEMALTVTSGEAAELSVDLNTQIISGGLGKSWEFHLPEPDRQVLLQGLDDIAQTARHSASIERYRETDRELRPWIHGGGQYRKT